jgi:hypothetical protein
MEHDACSRACELESDCVCIGRSLEVGRGGSLRRLYRYWYTVQTKKKSRPAHGLRPGARPPPRPHRYTAAATLILPPRHLRLLLWLLRLKKNSAGR